MSNTANPTAAGTITDKPRYLRVTFIDANGKRQKFIGRVRREGAWIKGDRQDDNGTGCTLSLFYAAPDEVVKVERQNPKYGDWEPDTPGPRSLMDLHVDGEF